MSDSRKFKFVSPGIFLNEIDQSQIPSLPDNVGPVIVGRTEKGPGMVPVRVNSFSEFVEKFGNPVAGRGGTLDVWRDGNYSSPTYAAYAAQAYLNAGVGPVTMVRLMGTESPDATTGGYAGWTTAKASPDTTIADNGGPMGLFVWSSGSANATATITFSNAPNADETITIISGDGTSVTLTCHATDTAGLTFARTGVDHGTDNLQTAIETNFGSKIQVTQPTSTSLLLTQTVAGAAGNTTITSGLANVAKTDFTGGTPTDKGTLAAVFYIDNGGKLVLKGSGAGAPGNASTLEGAAAVVQSNASGEFKALIYNSTSGVEENVTFSLNPDSDKFIRNVFNTNPQRVNTDIELGDNTKSYWLGESYERYLSDQSLNTAAVRYGAILAVVSGSTENGNHEKEMPYRDAHSGWFFAQNMNADNTLYEYNDMQKLFKFVGINGHGQWLQNNIKISILNIRASSNENVPYGTFDVIVRKVKDADTAPQILERFSGCTLDPSSLDYIAAKIGDTKFEWDALEKRYREYGSYPNQSEYIRVVMNDTVDNGGANSELLPFGVYGPPRFPGWSAYSASVAVTDAYPSTTGYASHDIPDMPTTTNDRFLYSGGSGGEGNSIHWGSVDITYPAVATRGACLSSTTADGADPTKNAYFGLQTSKVATGQVYDVGYPDYVRAFGKDIVPTANWNDNFGQGTLPGGLVNQWVFSLDEIVVTSGSSYTTTNPSNAITEATWTSGSYKAATSWNADPTQSGLGAVRYKNILDSKINRFTSPLFGGFDGLNIKERDPFRNSGLTSGTETTNYAYYSIKRAIDTVADAEVVEMNAACVPGLTNENLTKYLIDVCEERADALAIIDLTGGFTPRADDMSTNKTASDRKGDLDTVISNIKARNLNSSYGACYYPWVRIRDDINGAFLDMPPSVVALGVMANTERAADVWFAPAGFNRGGLSTGAGGLPVVNVETKLTSRNRDDLYEVNINPIASFPAEGIVVFGQKTVQATQSALDRINVRRLMIFVKRGISRIASTTLFQPNVSSTWNSFKSKADNFLADVKIRFGVDDFRVVLDETTTTADLIDRNIMYAKIFIKPTRAIEFIAVDFIITRSGASFED